MKKLHTIDATVDRVILRHAKRGIAIRGAKHTIAALGMPKSKKRG